MLTIATQFADCWQALASCRLREAAIYLAPSILLAVLIRYLAARHPAFFMFRLTGTICHELAHFTVGWLTGATPQSFSVIPRRNGNSWQLGVVTLTNVRWYNAAPAALAPLLILLIPAAVAVWRTRHGLNFEAIDFALAFLLAPQFLSCMPSIADWKIALRSWPYLILGGGLWWLWNSAYH